MFLALPSVRMYENLSSEDLWKCKSNMELVQWPWSVAVASQLVTDILKEKGFDAERLNTKWEQVMRMFCEIMHFLRQIHKRYIKLILLLALFHEGPEVPTDDFIADIIAHSANTYGVCEVSNGLLQYKWTKMVLTKRN